MPQNGKFDSDYPAVVVHVGLPYTSDFETLDIASMRSNIRDKQKIINAVSMIVDRSVGFKIGPDEDNLKEYKSRDTENYDAPDSLISELIDISIPAAYNKMGRIFVRQEKPLPLSILCVIPHVQGGGY
jgi:predicted RNase H-like nuclease